MPQGPIINPHTGKPMGAKAPEQDPLKRGTIPQQPGPIPQQPSGSGPMPGAVPPPQVNQEQLEMMFRQYHEGKMNNLLNALNGVIAEQQVDFATVVGALTILANVYSQKSITPPQQKPQPMGPPPPEMTGQARHEPAPAETPEMSAGGSSEPPPEPEPA